MWIYGRAGSEVSTTQVFQGPGLVRENGVF
jgi:hypothetical protein